jgi:integrase
MAAMSLSDAIDEYVGSRTKQYAVSTIEMRRRALSIFLAQTGNISVRQLDARHGEAFQTYLLSPGSGRMKNGYEPTTVNLYTSILSGFCTWARARKYLPMNNDPMATISSLDIGDKDRVQVKSSDFPRLLDSARTPHDRIVTALGLYLFLRQGEVANLLVGWVDLDASPPRIKVWVTKNRAKAGKFYVMPISEELEVELRRWLTWYANDVKDEHGSLQDDWFLVPGRNAPKMTNDGTGFKGGSAVWPATGNSRPTDKLENVHRYVQRPLEAFGVPLRGLDGSSNMEGVHTLRRSGARALFDSLIEQGMGDGALKKVSAMLHHKHTQMTQHYLGIRADEKELMDLLGGKPMFPKNKSDNVVPLRAVNDNNDNN